MQTSPGITGLIIIILVPKPEGDGNGYESIKMGGGDYSMYPLYTLVEKNFFYRCDGEVELISNKSWNNTYRHNTFYDCQGTLTLRWGRECLSRGIISLETAEVNTGGIRIYGPGSCSHQ